MRKRRDSEKMRKRCQLKLVFVNGALQFGYDQDDIDYYFYNYPYSSTSGSSSNHSADIQWLILFGCCLMTVIVSIGRSA